MNRTPRSLLERGRNLLRAVRLRRGVAAARADLLRIDPDETGEARLGPDSWHQSLANPTDFYVRCFRYFHRDFPPELRAHREYFTSEGRGYGEDAFHVMWDQLFRHFHPQSYLEIGVFRGQTLSLAGLLARRTAQQCETFGISPFASVGDSVSTYAGGIDYERDTLQNYSRFASPPPMLLKAYSTDDAARTLLASRAWDTIYIDGNHDYSVALQDWQNCARAVRPGGIIVLDDSGLSTSYVPPVFATGGHPGPSQVAADIDRSAFEEILQVGHNRVFRRRC